MTLRKLENDPITNSNYTIILFIISLIFLIGGYFVVNYQIGPIVRALETTPITITESQYSSSKDAGKTVTTTWRKKFNAKGMPLYIQCRLDSKCYAGLRKFVIPYVGIGMGMTGVLFLFSAIGISSMLSRKKDQLDTARWLAVDEYKHPEVLNYLLPNQGIEIPEDKDPVVVPLGFVIEQAQMPNAALPERPIAYKYVGLKKIGLTAKMLQEHVLVFGPTGTGKTSRVLMHFLVAFAKRKDATVVLDFKYPIIRESFMIILPLFRRLGNPVWPILPYAQGGYHVPLFDSIQTHQDGRDLAAIFIPKAEYGDSDSNFYKDTQVIILGAVFKIVAGSATPNFTEVIRILNQPPEGFLAWLEGNGDIKAKEALLRFLEAKAMLAWNGFITGIINALEAFDDDRVSRTFTSVEGHNFNPEEFITQGGLVYFGTDTDKMRTPRGEVIVRVFDNWLTNKLVSLRKDVDRTGPQKSIRLVYDEAPSIGRLRYVLKSVATLRAFDFSFIFGIQNEEQMELAYGDDVWSAIDQNLATQIILPTGFKKAAAAELSRNLGEREIRIKTTSQSASPGGISNTGARTGKSYVTQKRALATASEIGEWPYFLGILLTKGTLPPALLGLVPFYDPKPEYIGLDNRKFTLNNQEAYNEWLDIMDDLTPEQRDEEIWEVINDNMAEQDRLNQPADTMQDVFNEWIRFAVKDGAVFRRKGKEYEIKYETLHISLRGKGAEKAVIAFIANGWLNPGEGIQHSPEEWDWVRITPEGLKALGNFAQLELANFRYSSAYIQERKRLSDAAPDLGARYEEEREVLPEEAARNATMHMIRMEDATLSEVSVNKAADIIMSRFKVVETSPVKMVAIPLSMAFERIVPATIKKVQGSEENEDASDDLTFDQQAGLSERPAAAGRRAVDLDKLDEDSHAATASAPAQVQPSADTLVAQALADPPEVRKEGDSPVPAPPSANNAIETPDITVDEDEAEDTLSLDAFATPFPAVSPPAPAAPAQAETATPSAETLPVTTQNNELQGAGDEAPVPSVTTNPLAPTTPAESEAPKKRGNIQNLKQFNNKKVQETEQATEPVAQAQDATPKGKQEFDPSDF